MGTRFEVVATLFIYKLETKSGGSNAPFVSSIIFSLLKHVTGYMFQNFKLLASLTNELNSDLILRSTRLLVVDSTKLREYVI